ncbi:hypothetical protein SAMN05216369_1417 [Marinobacter antarcticus]|uniref:Uncharacterized protein n=1 Tax=Marinobacter antarcticus TaxID=564117 RepID=A0A1M6RC60_9GAMM|nr:hypothetical protein [Marinobacter antarcticus]SHK30051.1 hypothetical protein SAMN05216369_1417 [Marinobacter antarcticus]
MKFPTVTVTLVSAALLFVLWDQTREQQQAVDASRFTNLSKHPVVLGTAVDWAITQVPSLCEKATGQTDGAEAYSSCVKQAEARTSTCRRAAYDRFPSIVASESVFRDLSITLINCLVPDALS